LSTDNKLRDTSLQKASKKVLEDSRDFEKEEPQPQRYKVSIRDFDAWFGTKQALKSISLDVKPNTSTAIIGPSGCGKTTLIRCLNRMHEMTPGATAKGHVIVDDMDIYGKGIDPVIIKRRIGMVFQKPNPFPTMSIYDNVAAGSKTKWHEKQNYHQRNCRRKSQKCSFVGRSKK
jgi:ABC-type phosphate transport system, ATPase component